jgi:hypothetical protein
MTDFLVAERGQLSRSARGVRDHLRKGTALEVDLRVRHANANRWWGRGGVIVLWPVVHCEHKTADSAACEVTGVFGSARSARSVFEPVLSSSQEGRVSRSRRT